MVSSNILLYKLECYIDTGCAGKNIYIYIFRSLYLHNKFQLQECLNQMPNGMIKANDHKCKRVATCNPNWGRVFECQALWPDEKRGKNEKRFFFSFLEKEKKWEHRFVQGERYYITKPKPKWIAIPILGYSIKHHVVIHFCLHHQKGIAHDPKDRVKLHYPFQGILKMP